MSKKIIIIPLIVIGVFYLTGRFIYYGSLTKSCTYTESEMSIPKEIVGARLVIAKDAYLAIGNEAGYSCLPKFGKLDREIAGPEGINNFGKNYYTRRGSQVEPLKKGVSFKVVGATAILKHGITTIDSGSGPISYLILKDEKDVTYYIARVNLGINKGDRFMAIVDAARPYSASSLWLLGSSSFDEIVEDKEKYSLSFTGNLVESSEAYLKSTEPQWKKFIDRLEQGEKLSLHVDLWMRDDSYNEIKFADTQEERMRQVARIQDEFLKMIPSNITLSNVEKNSSWPFISMDASIGLVDHLYFDAPTQLKIKSITELLR